MTIGLVGSGPAIEAVDGALEDVDGAVKRTRIDLEALPSVDLAVVADTMETVAESGREAGASAREGVLSRANDLATLSKTPWVAIERGGLGGVELPDVAAAATGFGPETACYRCLADRVEANEATGVPGDRRPAPEPADPRGAVRLVGAMVGRELLRLLAGEPSSLLGGVLEVPHAERQVLPVPTCPVCGPERDRTLAWAHREVEIEDALARAEAAYDDRVGLVNAVGEAESFPVPYYLATVANTDGFSDAAAAAQAAGVDADWNPAFMKALGEAMERYCAGVYRTDELRVAPPEAMGDHAVLPAAFAGVDPETVVPDDPVRWAPSRPLDPAADGEDGPSPVWLPATFVHFPPPAQPWGPSITTGLGLGNSTVEAALSGLYEVIERDATMLAWYSTYEPLGLAVADEGYETLRARARAEGLSATALLVTQDVDVPVVAAAVQREDAWPKFAVGSGAALDTAAAARSALAEALQNWMELRGMGREGAREEQGAIGRYADFPAAAREFVDPDATVPAASVGPAEVPTGVDELAMVVERLEATEMSGYAARLTTRDVASLDFEAVRVCVPRAQPLFTGEPRLGERAEEVPAALGFEPRFDRELHPYP